MGVGLPAAAAASGGFPWSLVLPMGISFIGDIIDSIFGKSEEEKMYDRAMQAQNILRSMGMRPPYQSQLTGTVDKALAKALFSRMSKVGGWGWPEDMGVDFSFFEDLLSTSSLPGTVRRRT